MSSQNTLSVKDNRTGKTCKMVPLQRNISPTLTLYCYRYRSNQRREQYRCDCFPCYESSSWQR